MNIVKCRSCLNEITHSVIEFQNMPSRAQHLPDNVEESLSMKIDFSVLQCSWCGLVQIDENYVPYYKDVIRATSVSGKMRKFRLNQFKKFIDKYNLTEGCGVEVGCGTGDFLNIFRELNFRCIGIENSSTFVTQNIENGYECIQGFLLDDQIEINNIDAFFCFNYLEHLPSPSLFLKSLNKFLPYGSIGIIEVPNYNYLKNQRMISEFMIDHVTYFTISTLSNLLEQNGFEVLNSKEIWHDYIISLEVRNGKHLEKFQDLPTWEGEGVKICKYLEDNNIKNVFVWGAGHQSFAAIKLLSIEDKIQAILDSSINKQGKFCPSTSIPICSPNIIDGLKGKVCVLVMAGSYTSEIIEILQRTYFNVTDLFYLESYKLIEVKN